MEKSQNFGKVYLIPSFLAPDTQDKILTEQVKQVISHLDYFFVENVRTARRFISSLRLGKVIENLHFTELTKNTNIENISQNAQILKEGKDVGVISEAGCPAIADPGHILVSWAHQNQIQVIPLIGASSIMLALMASGFNGQNFVFHGYLPIDKNERSKVIRILEKDALGKKQTQIFMETPFRNNQLLDSILQNCQNQTRLCIATNITGEDEFISTQPVSFWKKNKPDLHKKPTIFLLYQ